MYNQKKVGLTITTCKRLDKFKESILSLSNHLLDKEILDVIIHYDDSSSSDDREIMSNLLKENFIDTPIVSRFFEPHSINHSKRHMEIMKNWKVEISSFGLDYVFHTEDDWLFEHEFNISEALDLISSNDQIGLVGFSQVLRNPPSEIPSVNLIGDFWEWIYLPDRPEQSHLFMDYDEMNLTNTPGYWCYFINWPHFGFRPAIHDVSKLNNLDNFSDESDSFELEFAKRFSKLYKAYFNKKRICKHIGDVSSYEINNSKR